MSLVDSSKRDSYKENVCIPISCGAFLIRKVFARGCVCVCVCVSVGVSVCRLSRQEINSFSNLMQSEKELN